jgi:hypothetical protein
MRKVTSLLKSVGVNAIVACVTVGIALGVTNVLVNHVHWLGAYLITCPNHGWPGQRSRRPTTPPFVILPPTSVGLPS